MHKTQRIHWFVVALLCSAVLCSAPPARAAENDAAPLVIGASVEGRAITAQRFGNGSRTIVIVGAIHGDEGNTATLVDYLSAAFRNHLDVVPSDVSLYFVTALNPDGLAANRRTNAHGVDLNRNWQTDNWQSTTVDADGTRVNGGGSAPFSEPESRAMADWLSALHDQQDGPVSVLFYHAAYPPRGLVLSGSVGREVGRAFADVIGYNGPSAGGGSGWTAYPVTGAAVTWCHDHDIGCFEIEFPNRSTLSAAASQSHAAAILGVLLRQQTAAGQRCFWETGVCIAGRMRAFWEANDGLRTFGLPLAPQQTQTVAGQDHVVEWFERVRLELHSENAPPNDVQLGALGTEALAQQGRNWWSEPQGEVAPDCRYFPATEHSVCGDFLAAWRTHGLNLDDRPAISDLESLALFGQPLSEAHSEQLPDGRTVVVQWFERVRLELDPAAPASERMRFGRMGSERVQAGG